MQSPLVISSLFVLAVFAYSSQANDDCHHYPRLMHDMNRCCPFHMYPNSSDITDQCKTSLGVSDAPDDLNGHRHRGNGMCFHDCMMKSLNLLDQDSKFVADKVDNYVDSYVADSFKQPVREALTLLCPEKMKEPHGEHRGGKHPPPPDAEAKQCSPFAVILSMCVKTSLFVNCPQDMWSNTEECNERRETLRKCSAN